MHFFDADKPESGGGFLTIDGLGKNMSSQFFALNSASSFSSGVVVAVLVCLGISSETLGQSSCGTQPKSAFQMPHDLREHLTHSSSETALIKKLLQHQRQEFLCEGKILESLKNPTSEVRKTVEDKLAEGLKNLAPLALEIRELENLDATWELPPEATAFGAVSAKDDRSHPYRSHAELQKALQLRKVVLEAALGTLPFGNHPEMNPFLKKALLDQKALRGQTVFVRPPFNTNEFLDGLRGKNQKTWNGILDNLKLSHQLEQSKLETFLQPSVFSTRLPELQKRLGKLGFFSSDSWPALNLAPAEKTALDQMNTRLQKEDHDRCHSGLGAALGFLPKVGDLISLASDLCTLREDECPVDVPTSFKKGMCEFLTNPKARDSRPEFYGQARSLSGCSTSGGVSLAAAILPYGGKFRSTFKGKALVKATAAKSDNLPGLFRLLDTERELERSGSRLPVIVPGLREMYTTEQWVWAHQKRETIDRLVADVVGKSDNPHNFVKNSQLIEEVDLRLALINNPGRVSGLDKIVGLKNMDYEYTRGRAWTERLNKELQPMASLLTEAEAKNPELKKALQRTQAHLAKVIQRNQEFEASLNNFGGFNRNQRIQEAAARLAKDYNSFLGTIGETQFKLRSGKGFEYNSHLTDHVQKQFSDESRRAAFKDPTLRQRMEDLIPVDLLKFAERYKNTFPTPDNLHRYRMELIRGKELDAVKMGTDGVPTWIEIKNFVSPLRVDSENYQILAQQMDLLQVSAEAWQKMGGKAPRLELVLMGGINPQAIAELQRRYGSRVTLRY